MHCHTKEGSIDSSVSIYKYISEYRKLGYDGIMITDHNSYRGCKEWERIRHLPECRGFTAICGIEYDTKDAGHVLVVMPDGIYLPLLKVRGMRCRKLMYVVHSCGGVIGMAHPFGAKSSSAMGFRLMKKELIKEFDFIEVFNTCESEESNSLAAELAEAYDLPGTAGTDAHQEHYLGMAVTEIYADIRSNNDFIKAVKQRAAITASGREREKTTRGKAKEHWTAVIGYQLYNRGIAKARVLRRKASHYRLTHASAMSHMFEKEWKEVKREWDEVIRRFY